MPILVDMDTNTSRKIAAQVAAEAIVNAASIARTEDLAQRVAAFELYRSLAEQAEAVAEVLDVNGKAEAAAAVRELAELDRQRAIATLENPNTARPLLERAPVMGHRTAVDLGREVAAAVGVYRRAGGRV